MLHEAIMQRIGQVEAGQDQLAHLLDGQRHRISVLETALAKEASGLMRLIDRLEQRMAVVEVDHARETD